MIWQLMTFREYFVEQSYQTTDVDLATVILNYAESFAEKSPMESRLDERAFFDDLMSVLNGLSEKEVSQFVNQIMFNPELANILMPHIGKLLNISIRDYGSSSDNWSPFAKTILAKIELSDIEKKRSALVSEFLSNWKKERRKLKTALAQGQEIFDQQVELKNLLGKEWQFLRVQGRTLLFTSKNSDKILAIKIQKKDESVVELHKQKNAVNFLNKNKKALKLQSQYPTPISIAKVSGIDEFLGQLARDKKISEETFSVLNGKINVSNNDTCLAYVYETKKDYEFDAEDYFTYLHNPKLTPEQFFLSLKRGINDVLILFKNGMIYHQLVDLFHTEDQKRHYITLTNLLINSASGSGEIENYLSAVEFVNLRRSGAADEGDFHKLETFVKEIGGKFAKKFLQPQHKTHVPAELLAQILLVMELTTVSYAVQSIEKDKSKDAEAFWENLGKQLRDLYKFAFSLLTGMPEAFVRDYFNDKVWDPRRYGKQMRYFLTDECVDDLLQGKIKPGIFSEETQTTIKKDFSPSFIENNKRGSDSGPLSSQHPVKEGDFIRYSFVTFYLATQQAIDEFKVKLREAKKYALAGNISQARNSFLAAHKLNPTLFTHFQNKIERKNTEKEQKYAAYRQSALGIKREEVVEKRTISKTTEDQQPLSKEQEDLILDLRIRRAGFYEFNRLLESASPYQQNKILLRLGHTRLIDLMESQSRLNESFKILSPSGQSCLLTLLGSQHLQRIITVYSTLTDLLRLLSPESRPVFLDVLGKDKITELFMLPSFLADAIKKLHDDGRDEIVTDLLRSLGDEPLLQIEQSRGDLGGQPVTYHRFLPWQGTYDLAAWTTYFTELEKLMTDGFRHILQISNLDQSLKISITHDSSGGWTVISPQSPPYVIVSKDTTQLASQIFSLFANNKDVIHLSTQFSIQPYFLERYDLPTKQQNLANQQVLNNLSFLDPSDTKSRQTVMQQAFNTNNATLCEELINKGVDFYTCNFEASANNQSVFNKELFNSLCESQAKYNISRIRKAIFETNWGNRITGETISDFQYGNKKVPKTVKLEFDQVKHAENGEKSYYSAWEEIIKICKEAAAHSQDRLKFLRGKPAKKHYQSVYEEAPIPSLKP